MTIMEPNPTTAPEAEEAHGAECGVSYEHDWEPGLWECRECGADLSDWNDDGNPLDPSRS